VPQALSKPGQTIRYKIKILGPGVGKTRLDGELILSKESHLVVILTPDQEGNKCSATEGIGTRIRLSASRRGGAKEARNPKEDRAENHVQVDFPLK